MSHFGRKRRFRGRANGGRNSARCQPDAITRDFAFPIYGFTKLLGSRPPTHYSRCVKFWPKNVDFDGEPTVGGIHPDSNPLQLRGILLFQFRGSAELLKSNSLNRHSRQVAFWSKTSISRVRQRWAEFSKISGK